MSKNSTAFYDVFYMDVVSACAFREPVVLIRDNCRKTGVPLKISVECTQECMNRLTYEGELVSDFVARVQPSLVDCLHQPRISTTMSFGWPFCILAPHGYFSSLACSIRARWPNCDIKQTVKSWCRFELIDFEDAGDEVAEGATLLDPVFFQI